MQNIARYPGLEELSAFHGHLCPGLAIGYRATVAGLETLGVERARDEELIAIVENDSCSVDAVQFLAGATFGKGNFFFRDWGKQVFTFGRRDQSRAVRVALKWGAVDAAPGKKQTSGAEPGSEGSEEERAAWRQQRIDYILNAPLDEMFDVREVEIELPPTAVIRRSVRCDICGEPVMESRTTARNGKTLCAQCAEGE